MSTPTAAVRSSLKSPAWLRVPERNCPTFTFPSLVWKICSFTIPEGACAIELENVFRHAGARRSRSASQRHAIISADLPAAVALCFHLRQGDGGKWLYACRVQKPPAPGDHRDQHDLYRSLGGGYAVDRRVSVDPRNRRPAACSDQRGLDRDRESRRGNAAGAGRWASGDPAGLARASARSSDQHRYALHLRGDYSVGRGFFIVR